eukprot:CAMPEP_0114566414 /NCGR_PEP_ID=MMETSP0114-20121206/14873_1 /TAXON_ID=31324 /ORGANISM="Goniomonas sp, Strain m" /LENGTH=180 /DNA_ID=CAMNT_0001752811 /DNA_START=348 /DNA_END=887 /DNA_ORIENTATION=-
MRPPKLWTTHFRPGSFILHYVPTHPSRGAFGKPFIVGIVRSYAKACGVSVEFREPNSSDDDELFVICWRPQGQGEPEPETAPSVLVPSQRRAQHFSSSPPPSPYRRDPGRSCSPGGRASMVFAADPFTPKCSPQGTNSVHLHSFSLPANEFASAFPFHIIVNSDLAIMQVGNSLPTLIPE